MYKTGQLIWLKNIDTIENNKVKDSRLCIIRKVYDYNTVDVRVLSTIYFDKKKSIPAKTLKEAEKVLKNLFETKIQKSGQYVIFEPENDNTINFSFTFGNTISKKVKLENFIHTPLLGRKKEKLYISDKKELELSIKEAEAIAQNIIRYFKIQPKEKVTE